MKGGIFLQMRKIVISAVIFLFCLQNEMIAQQGFKYVNPFIGTTNSKVFTHWGAEGGTYPGAVAPFGFVQLTPETKNGYLKGYDYRDSLIYHFTCMGHFSGYPGGSAGAVKIMPLQDQTATFAEGRRFSHNQEHAEPAYYSVRLIDDNTLIETSASERTGMFKITFPPSPKVRIFIDLQGKTEFVSDHIVHGEFNYTSIEFNRPIQEKAKLESGYILSFQPINNEPLLLKISFSNIDFKSSAKNISSECPGWNFYSFRKTNQEKWSKLLSLIEITDPSESNKTIFYTALYHSLLMPWIISDSDGLYRGADGQIHHTKGNNEYGAFSPWDTFRTLHPLQTLLVPDRQNDMIQSALDVFEQTGKLPKGPMTGQHIIPIITDSYFKGINKFDKNLALRAMQSTLSANGQKEKDFAQYLTQGYVSYDFPESVTKTLEFAYDDWAVAQFAGELGDSLANKQFTLRSKNYANLFEPQSGFFLPRKNETFINEPEGRGYKEGDKWIYSLFLPHDPVNLVNLAGGSDSFSLKLDSALNNKLILFDNEPAFHIPYLFNFTKQSYLTQKWARAIMQSNYSPSPDGLPGNDDLGSMSSWYVFSAMGFFPFCPGRPVYELGSPLFHEITLNLPSGRKWAVRAERNSPQNIYVSKTMQNKIDYSHQWISHSTITDGGELTFFMDSVPARNQFANSLFTERSDTPDYAQIRVVKFDVSEKEVVPDQPFEISCVLENKGSAGTFELQLFADGKPSQVKNIFVNTGETKTETITCRLYPFGIRKLSMNGLPERLVSVTNPTTIIPKKFQIANLNCNPLFRMGETGKYSYSVKNLCGQADTALVKIYLDNKIIAADSVWLEPGQAKLLEHVLPTDEKGIFNLKAGNISRIVKIYDSNAESDVLNISPSDVKSEHLVFDISGMKNNGFRETGTGESCDEVLRFDPSESLNQFGKTITLMAWVKPEKYAMADLISKGDHIVIQCSGHALTFFAGGWGLGDCTAPLPANWLNNWHHVAGVCNGKLLQLYIDGKLAATTNLDFQPKLKSFGNWMAGGNEEFPNERIFKGKIDEIRIFKEALSANEIQEVMGISR
jgi:alpha-1,2-mannosidase, putative